MTKYVKFINKNQIEYPPINKGSIFNYNLDIDRLIADGYKPLQEAEKPEDGDYTLTYRNTKNYVKEVVTLPTPEEIAERERIRVLGLKCTKRVFALILQEMGVSYTQLKELIASNERAQLEWDLCVELERSNPLLNIMAAELGFDSTTVDNIFKYANGENVTLQTVAENEELPEE